MFTIDTDEEDQFTVDLYDAEEHIGYVNVVRARVRVCKGSTYIWETHSRLNEKYHKTGLGICMYAEAIRHAKKSGYTITSSRAPSAQAQRLWTSKTLNSMFSIIRFHFRWWVK